MFKLEKSLKEWVSQGVLPPEQAARIRAYEAAKPERRWVMAGVLTLAFITIGVGLLSLATWHWNTIPDSVKLIVDGVLFLAIIAAMAKLWRAQKPIWFEGSLLFFMIFCLASILLINKIFLLDYQKSFYPIWLIWSGVTFFPVFLARRILVPFFWCVGTFIGLFALFINAEFLKLIFSIESVSRAEPIIACMTLSLLFTAAFFVGRKIAIEAPLTRALRIMAFIAVCSAVAVADMAQIAKGHWSVILYTPAYILSVVVALAIWRSGYHKIEKKLLLCTLFSFLAYFHVLGGSTYIVYALGIIFILALLAGLFAVQKNRVWFQVFLGLIGARIVVLYFQALGGFVTTGFGLVIAGLLLLLIIFFWNKYRSKINSWLG